LKTLTAENPLGPLVSEMIAAMSAGYNYLCLLQSLAIPDICGAIMNEDGRATKSKYIEWYNEYIYKYFVMLPADTCYSLRCGVIHQSKGDVKNNQIYNRIEFCRPGNYDIFTNRTILHGDVLTVNLEQFCIAMEHGVIDWYEKERSGPIFRKNAARVMRPRHILQDTDRAFYGPMVIG